ncbi:MULTISPECIES: DUF6056 family protein [unclassified Enterobacter]|uniref:DUF6056 family protein n=1 Tax=unclassified Enterobacter TaxID=2608935 RepID=UPI000F1DC6B1|nr:MULTISPECIES: DUF6056 family protein [unclassified Enterobacter]RMA89636.1 hypothetical protein BJ885_1596 [Enterobacter sp. WP_7_1]RMA99604.1 hypothetical protein BJ886_1692 [Enterobacter sp. WP_7_2]
MISRNNIIVIGVIFLLMLVPYLHTPVLSDDYYYYFHASFREQIGHYLVWSGRVVTNIFSSYMLRYVNHDIYQALTAIALSASVYLIAAIPSALLDTKPRPSAIAIIIIFLSFWVSNPALGETFFWFVGASNYLWPIFYISLFFVILARQRKSHSVLSYAGAIFIGFLAGCSNENTCIIATILTILYALSFKRFRLSAPYLIGLVMGSSVLLFSPGASIRSSYFEDWHSLTLLEKIDQHLFERLPAALDSLWPIFLIIIFITLSFGMLKIESRVSLTCALSFFIGGILCDLAFVASPYMPERAGIGALFMFLISLSFLIYATNISSEKLYRNLIFGFVILFALTYFLPSYGLISYSFIRASKQDAIRMSMLTQQINQGKKEVVIPDFYLNRLLKKSDGFPTFKNSYMFNYFKVDKIIEEPINFDYSVIESLPKKDINARLNEGIILKSIYFYTDRLSGKNKLIYRISGDVNVYLSKGNAIFSHVTLRDNKTINMDTAIKAVKVKDDWYTYSDAGKLNLSEIGKINIGMYTTEPVQVISSSYLEFK